MANDTNKKSLDKLKDEEEIVERIKSLYEEAQEAAEPRHEQIKKNWRFYLGDQWLTQKGKVDKRAPEWRMMYRGVRDICFATVENVRPVLHSGRPQVIVSADFDEDKQIAERATEILDAEYEWRSEGTEIGKLNLDTLVAGVGLRKISFDFARNCVNSQIINPLDFFPDPYGTRTDFFDHRYIIHEIWMEASDIERRFRLKEKDYAEGSGASEGTGIFDFARRLKFWDVEEQEQIKYGRKRFPVWDVYYSEALPIEIMTAKTPKTLKYPRGRHFVVVNSKKLVVDEDNPYNNEVPFVLFSDYTQPRSIWALGEIDHLIHSQVPLNILLSLVMTNTALASNVQWIVPKGSIPKGMLTNQPGLVIPVDRNIDAKNIRRIMPAPVPGGVINLMGDLESHAQRVTSVSEVMAGRQPGSQTSGIAIQSLQEAALGRQRFKLIHLDEALRRQAKIEFGLVQDYMDFLDPRLVRRMGMGEWLLWDDKIRDLLYDIDVISKSELPHSIEGRINFGMRMMEIGIFDALEFLDFTGLNVRQELEGLLQSQFNMQMMQMMAAMGQGGMPMQPGQGAGRPTERSITERKPDSNVPTLQGVENLGQGREGSTESLAGMLA